MSDTRSAAREAAADPPRDARLEEQLLSLVWGWMRRAREASAARTEAAIDRGSFESFPASDPVAPAVSTAEHEPGLEEIDCTVDAPQSLAGLAQLERTRRDAGPFPLHLDRDGMLVAKPRPLPSDALHRASDLAGRTLDRAMPDPGVRLALLDLVASLTAGQQTAWPQDLFHPAAAHRLDRRTIVLPDGTEGQVEVEVVSLPGGNESTRVQRTVTTELGKSRRTTREEWVLAPARAR